MPDRPAQPAPAAGDGFAWVIGIAGAACAVVWAGAALALAVTGHGPDGRIGLTGAAQALVRLPGHLGEPAQAWPEPARTALPGPVVYWTSQAAVTAAATAAGVGGLRVWRGLRGDRRRILGVKAEAGFASRRDLRPLAVARPTPGRLTLGTAHGRLLACEPQASLAVVGPTGCGKTAGFAVPALLEWRGPVIATSVKADLLEATIDHRRRQGEVWVYDPTRCAGQGCARWSPLPACRDWKAAMQLSAAMIDAAQPAKDSVTQADYWYTQARKTLAPYLHAAALAGAGMDDVVRWIDTQHRTEVEDALRRPDRPAGTSDWHVLWEHAVAKSRMELRHEAEGADLADRPWREWPDWLQEEIRRTVDVEWAAEQSRIAGHDPLAALTAARAAWSKEPRLRGSVFATVENVLSAWADPDVCAHASGNDIDLGRWLQGDNTIYVVAAPYEQQRLRPVLTVLVQTAIRQAYETASRNRGCLDRPLLALLDEAGNTAPLQDLPSYASTARSHGISFVTVWQDIAQIETTYSQRYRTVLNNHRAKLFGAGIDDPATLDYLSKLVGDEHRTERNLSTDLTGGRRSVSEHPTYRRAAPVDVLRRIQPGHGVLLYGSRLPAHVHLRPWFADARLRATAERPDLIRT